MLMMRSGVAGLRLRVFVEEVGHQLSHRRCVFCVCGGKTHKEKVNNVTFDLCDSIQTQAERDRSQMYISPSHLWPCSCSDDQSVLILFPALFTSRTDFHLLLTSAVTSLLTLQLLHTHTFPAAPSRFMRFKFDSFFSST